MKINSSCFACCKEGFTKDELGINKKMLGMETKQFYCLNCLADYLDVTTDELLAKIEEFKEQGCKFF